MYIFIRIAAYAVLLKIVNIEYAYWHLVAFYSVPNLPPTELLEIIYLYYIVNNPIFHETKLIYACGGHWTALFQQLYNSIANIF